MTEKEELKGLGGWLILVMIQVVIGPLGTLLKTCSYYSKTNHESWELLTTVGSAVYNPYWKPYIMMYMFYYFFLFVICSLQLYLFFKKHYWFPNLYIIISAVSILFNPFCIWLRAQAEPDKVSSYVIYVIIFQTFMYAVWILYMLKSQRVKNTFVKKVPDL